MTKKYFATVARGLEEIAAKELKNLGATNVTHSFTGVSFEGDQALLYRVNLWARTIFRVLMPIREIKCYNQQQLYKNVTKIDWQEYFTPEQTIAVKCTGGNENLNHTHFTALGIKNAIVDQQRQKTGKRSNIDTQNPDLLINAHINGNNCILSLDSTGESLHRRGYHQAMGLAPLKESLAAALLEMTDYNGDIAFLDPMCGSGTLPIEATLKALNIAPGLLRKEFAFQRWQNFNPSVWDQLVNSAKNQQLSQLKAPIMGSDHSMEMIKQAKSNAKSCQLEHHLHLTQKDLSEIEPPTEKGIIICNPPYGYRLSETEELYPLYKQLGDIFKQRFKGWTAYILTGNKELAKRVGLRTSQRIPLYNGSLPCTLLKYELY